MNAHQQLIRLLPLALLLSWSPHLYAKCESPVATLSSQEGTLELRRATEVEWRQARNDEKLCAGDTLRVDNNSRGALILADHTLVRLGASTTVTITGPKAEKGYLIKLLEGITHFMSRVPRTLEVETPFVNAGVEGTEFLVRVDSKETFVSVYEGKVALDNSAGHLLLTKGQSGAASIDGAPVMRVVVRPRDAVMWTLYYPAVISGVDSQAGSGDSELLSRVIDLQSEGKYTEALSVMEQATGLDANALVRRASLYLAVGQAGKAGDDIERSLALSPGNGDALALKSIIEVVQGEDEQALQDARSAVKADPDSAAAQLALSYALQAQYRLDDSLEVISSAVSKTPENALLWARLAELHLMFRNIEQAQEASEHAINLDANSAHAYMVLGFSHLVAMDTEAASTAFNTSIEMDPSAPLPRLGLGLALIHEGELERGRRAIEEAAILDPGNALIRSYLGKAYFEEKRDNLADDQYVMASDLDPMDPTPYFYSAIMKQVDNRPVEALDSLEEAIEKNDNRAVYRSRLLLDGDQASRSASIGSIYSTLGFDQLARAEADASLSRDPANYSAHRLLADSYSSLPRHEIARASELLKSQLLQPLNHSPLQPHIAENDLFIIERAGAGDAAYHEYHPLFVQDGVQAQASLMGGSQGTLSDEVIISGTEGRYAYSLGQYHYQSDGFRENNDVQHDIYNAFGQVAISPRFSLQAEYRYRETESGDLNMRFDPESYLPYLRKAYRWQTGRLGLHYQPGTGQHVIGSFIYREIDGFYFNEVIEDLSAFDAFYPFDTVGTSRVNTFEQNSSGDANQADFQYIDTRDEFTATLGIGYIEQDYETEYDFYETLVVPDDRFVPVPPAPEPNEKLLVDSFNSDSGARYRNAYAYFDIKALNNLVWTLGASYDSYDYKAGDENAVNPKVGLSWQPTPGTQVRAAWFKTTTRPFTTNQTIEPTQVAGFNQFFEETIGTQSRRYGLALDQRLSRNVSVGISASRRESEQPRFYAATGIAADDNEVEEAEVEAYLYWKLNPRLALSASAVQQNMEQDEWWPVEVNTLRLPLGLRYFGASGLYVTAIATYVDQRNQSTGTASEEEERFWNVDASVGYKLPRRSGIIRFGAKNLFNKEFQYQDSHFWTREPLSPEFLPEHVLFAELRINTF